jgi:hypothetical protein
VLVISGLVSSLFVMSRDWLSDPHRFLANLTVSAAVGTIVASSTLYSSFVESFVASTLPLASFLIAPALGSVALEIRTLLGTLGKRRHIGTLCTVVVLLPLVMASVGHVRPTFEDELRGALRASLREQLSGAPRFEWWGALPGVVFELTGGRAARANGTDDDPASKD